MSKNPLDYTPDQIERSLEKKKKRKKKTKSAPSLAPAAPAPKATKVGREEFIKETVKQHRARDRSLEKIPSRIKGKLCAAETCEGNPCLRRVSAARKYCPTHSTDKEGQKKTPKNYFKCKS